MDEQSLIHHLCPNGTMGLSVFRLSFLRPIRLCGGGAQELPARLLVDCKALRSRAPFRENVQASLWVSIDTNSSAYDLFDVIVDLSE